MGCGANSSTIPTPTQEQINSARVSPLPNNYKEQIKAYFYQDLVDPAAAEYTFFSNKKGYSTQVNEDRSIVFGTEVYFRCTSRTSGGNIRGENYMGFFVNGKLKVLYKCRSYDRYEILYHFWRG